MKYRVRMRCWDTVETHYYTTEVEGKDDYDAAYQARVKYAKSKDYPERLSKYSLEDRIEEPTILWIVEMNEKHLCPDDFKFIKHDWSGCYVNFHELCKMIDNGVITVNRNKLKGEKSS